ncbi:RebB family R body protein [Bradyrhizobium iriomotense]|uniref:RebB family R body protein n=1 Tax=Bradyrhizobium iriomotense TaxID=441950 RepID=UPI001B8A49AF|nr:RebB family R body protein [Bradyrhizobium iriomotense]MBR0783360.1 RebB family R body protein [Bradyrhizobium iriomotense]
MTDTAVASDAPHGELNDQIRDAVEQLNASLKGMAPNVPEAIAFQAMAHAVALALQNTVLQQQHDHMLRSSLTTAAAVSLLEGRRDEAEAVLKLADEKLGGRLNLSEEIAKVGEVLKSIGEQFKTH